MVGTIGFEPTTSFLLCKLCVHRKANDASVKESVTLINFAVACFFANSFYLKSQKLPLEAFLDFNPKQALNGRIDPPKSRKRYRFFASQKIILLQLLMTKRAEFLIRYGGVDIKLRTSNVTY